MFVVVKHFGVSSRQRVKGFTGSGTEPDCIGVSGGIRPFRRDREAELEFGAAPWWASRDERESWRSQRNLQ